MSRLAELIAGRSSRGKIVFSGARRRLTSMAVRGDQMAEELGGICIRSRYLSPSVVQAAPALIWVVEPDLSLVRRFEGLTPQILDVINPAYEAQSKADFYERCRAFQYLLLNTKSTRNYMGQAPERGWKSWVVPHHHCNTSNYLLPEDRLESPRVVGYVGQPEHLHDVAAIEKRIRQLGLTFLNADTKNLSAYELIDIGIAWTRPEAMRDETRSNIKMANFAAHGIPSVLCDYESYRDCNEALDGGAAVLKKSFDDWLDGLADLVKNEELRRSMGAKGPLAQVRYSRKSIAALYRGVIFDIQTTPKSDTDL